MVTPNFFFEKLLWRKGHRFVGGIDEVGRGSFAGPIVCGCVVFEKLFQVKSLLSGSVKIDDSKKLTAKQRQIAGKWIRKNALSWGIGVVSVAEINRLGLTKATASGFRRAVSQANSRSFHRIVYLLIDAFYVPYIRGIHMPLKKDRNRRERGNLMKNNGQQLAIINGDEKSLSIAAASIIAKVYRDKLMIKLARKPYYKKYAWDKNKGYGTEEHRQVIKKYGISKMHRRIFIKIKEITAGKK